MGLNHHYTGRYFDGISTRAQPVNVVLKAGKIEIGQPGVWEQPLLWEIGELYSLEKANGKLILKHGGLNDLQILEVEGEKFQQELRYSGPSVKKINVPASPFKYIVASLLFLAVTSLALLYFFVLPWLQRKAIELFPKETEMSMGKAMLEGFVANERVDKKATLLLNNFNRKSNIHSNYPVHITVVESPTVNAFALPGGEIVVYSGILNKMTTYGELVALLGHETGHVQRRHTLKLLFKQFSLGLIIGSVFQNYGDLTALLIRNAAEIHKLSYNREAEEEADQFAFEVMQETGTDPKGMLALFEHMQEDSKGASAPPEFLLTHPTIDHRIKVIRALRAKSKKHYSRNTELELLWKSIKAAESQEDSSSGF